MINRFAEPFLELPRPVKRLLVLAVDVALCIICVTLAFSVRLEEWQFMEGAQQWAAIAAVGIALPLFVVFGLYRAIFRYSGTAALMALVQACMWFGIAFFAVFTVIQVPGVPRSIGLSVPLLIFVMVGGSRLFARYWLGGIYVGMLNRKTLPQVLIYGAGTAGRQLAAALAQSPDMVVRAFLDDEFSLQRGTLNGLSVYSPDRLPDLVHERGITDVLLALPSISPSRRAEIVRNIQMQNLQLHVRTLPDVARLARGQVQAADLHELDIEDLLGRATVPPDAELLRKNIHGKVVLVTGAGGSIGSELCRQIMKLEPATLLLVDASEFALYAVHGELERIMPESGLQLLPLLASVRDESRMLEIMQTWSPSTVYHAAAYKHVPMVEHNPAEGVRNNVIGTLITAQAALKCGVSDFVLISTDKAVRPTNVMGASKRLAEMVLQGLAQERGRTRFSMVRFGNVLGSSGSVVPLFRKQIREGGPITLTHHEITRYFMTIPEAAQLVIQAGAMATGGDVFVLDMGTPVKIIDLAKRMVELSGLTVRDESNPTGQIALRITGLRPGEKLYEELLIGDNPEPTLHPRIMKAHEDVLPWTILKERLSALEVAISTNNVPLIRQILEILVSGYQPADEIVDWVHLKHRRRATDIPFHGLIAGTQSVASAN